MYNGPHPFPCTVYIISDSTDILAFKLHDVGGAAGLMAIHSLGWYTGGGNLVCAVTQNVPNDWNSKGTVSLFISLIAGIVITSIIWTSASYVICEGGFVLFNRRYILCFCLQPK